MDNDQKKDLRTAAEDPKLGLDGTKDGGNATSSSPTLDADRSQKVTKKVMLLYIIHRASGLTENQLTDIAISTLYFDYFSQAQLTEELIHDGCIQVIQRKGEQALDAGGKPYRRCYLTPRGENVMKTLRSTLSLPVIRNLNRLTAIISDAKRRILPTAECRPDPFTGFRAELALKEGESVLIQLGVTVPTVDLAEEICERWKEDSEKLYPHLLRLLCEGIQKEN